MIIIFSVKLSPETHPGVYVYLDWLFGGRRRWAWMYRKDDY
jgi:hypothetical protein